MHLELTIPAVLLAVTAALSGAEAPKFGAGEMLAPARTFYVSMTSPPSVSNQYCFKAF